MKNFLVALIRTYVTAVVIYLMCLLLQERQEKVPNKLAIFKED